MKQKDLNYQGKENSGIFQRYMDAQINEIENFIKESNPKLDSNELALHWIEEHGSQFRAQWQHSK